MSITLWGTEASPFVAKVMICLTEKKLSYALKPILPRIMYERTKQAIPKQFDKMSPLGQIPMIEIDGFTIADSSVIAAYLERKYSGQYPLYPDAPEQYARCLWFERYADLVMDPVTRKNILYEIVAKPRVLHTKPDQRIINKAINKKLPPILAYLDKEIAGKNWLCGDEFSVADAAVLAQLMCLYRAEKANLLDPYTTLLDYINRAQTRESVISIGIN